MIEPELLAEARVFGVQRRTRDEADLNLVTRKAQCCCGSLTAEADAARTEKGGKITVLSIAGLIGRAIQANHEETSVSKLFT